MIKIRFATLVQQCSTEQHLGAFRHHSTTAYNLLLLSELYQLLVTQPNLWLAQKNVLETKNVHE